MGAVLEQAPIEEEKGVFGQRAGKSVEGFAAEEEH